MSRHFLPTLIGAAVLAATGVAHAAPTFSSAIFATAPTGASGPDSVTVAAGSVWVAYDGTALSSDGSQPAGFSTVARYSMNGTLQQSYKLNGDVDGLKYNASTGLMWATQNQDANSSVTLIDPGKGTMTQAHFAVTSSTQGVDDLVFTKNGTFLSTTNPSSPSDATLTRLVDGTSPMQVTTVATAGQAGLNIVTGAHDYVPAIVNTDSLKVAPNGDLVQTTGNRDTLLFIKDAGLSTQSFSYLTLSANGQAVSGVDDSLYLTSSAGTLFAAVSNTNQVLAINYSGVTPGTLLASIGSLKEIGLVDPLTGNVTPLVTGLSGIHGLDAVSAVPEPANVALLLAGLGTLLGFKARGARRVRRGTDFRVTASSSAILAQELEGRPLQLRPAARPSRRGRAAQCRCPHGCAVPMARDDRRVGAADRRDALAAVRPPGLRDRAAGAGGHALGRERDAHAHRGLRAVGHPPQLPVVTLGG